MSDEPLTREALEIFVHDLTVEINRQIQQVTMRRILAGDAYLRAQLTARDVRLAALEKEVALDNVLIADRDRVLQAIPCPEHGPCVPHALEWIQARKLGKSSLAEAQATIAGYRQSVKVMVRRHDDRAAERDQLQATVAAQQAEIAGLRASIEKLLTFKKMWEKAYRDECQWHNRNDNEDRQALASGKED